jgi:hypothetical protein
LKKQKCWITQKTGGAKMREKYKVMFTHKKDESTQPITEEWCFADPKIADEKKRNEALKLTLAFLLAIKDGPCGTFKIDKVEKIPILEVKK